MKNRIKALYDEANSLHVQAKDILTEFNGKDMPADKKSQVDALLDSVDAKVNEAKTLERAEEQNKFLNDPATRKSFFQDKEHGQRGDGDDRSEGQQKDARKAAWLKFAAQGPSALTEVEAKDLSVGVPSAGGYLTVDTWMGEMIPAQREVSAMRRISRVLPPVPVGSVIAPSEDSLMTDATWTTEILTGNADTVKPFGQRKLTPHALAKRVLVSNDLLRNPSFDVEAYVRQGMAYNFAIPEEAAYVNGSGVAQPLGVLNTNGLTYWTTAASTTVTGDDIVNWVYSLPATYAGGARILCNRAFIRKCRTLKDGVGNYIWQAGLQSGTPNSILDVPYELSDQVDDALSAADAWEANGVPAVIGNFQYFWIVDALGMSIQRLVELYAATNQVGFIGRKASDGMVVRQEAFKGLKIKA